MSLTKTRSRGRSTRVSNGLVALGSAAVLTVYAAGYARTRPAAARFALEAQRRPATPATVPSAPELAPVRPAAVISEPPTQAPPTSKQIVIQPQRKSAPVSRPAPSVEATPVVATPSAALTTPEPTPIVEPPQAPPKPQYKDGTYLGWGTSRHGDIQASVVIAGGRIESATIAQCLTRYACSWIAALPPQVAARQSPEVDYVSGATQSTNAFYYAVVEALNKAK
jgi:uncharacterized protein with FMN-binding domain